MMTIGKQVQQLRERLLRIKGDRELCEVSTGSGIAHHTMILFLSEYNRPRIDTIVKIEAFVEQEEQRLIALTREA